MHAVEALAHLGGAGRQSHLRSLGVTQRELASAVTRGLVHRHAYGLYALTTCTPAHLAAAAVGGVLSCLDAAREHGLAVMVPDGRVHLRAARGTERTWPGTEVHRVGAPGQGRLDLVAALVTAAHCAPTAVVVALVDEALRERRCTVDQLVAASSARDLVWRHVLSLVDARAMSGLESLARVELVQAFAPRGITVESQVALDGIGRVDLLVDGWIITETDGFGFHADRTSYRRDRRRDAVAAANGYPHLRFTFESVVRMDGSVSGVVEDVWARGRPPRWRDLRRSGVDRNSARGS